MTSWVQGSRTVKALDLWDRLGTRPGFASKVINRKMKKIVLLDFKRTSDSSESYYQDMYKVSENQYTPILTGVRTLTVDRDSEWEVEVVPLFVLPGQRSVNGKEITKEWLETFKIFGIGKEDGKKIMPTPVVGESHIGPCLPV